MRMESLIPRFIRRRVYFERKMIRWPGIFEVSLGHWGLGLELINSGIEGDYRYPWMFHVNILPLAIFLHLPLPRRPVTPDKDGYPRYGEQDSWGATLHFGSGLGNAIHAHWGARCRIWELPFVNWIHVRTEVRRPDGSWAPFVGSWEEKGAFGDKTTDWRGEPLKDPDGRERLTFPYRYELRGGDVQTVNAEVSARRDIRRRKWLTWTRFAEWTDNSIDVNFDNEVGERAGSWKGGCLGCGWTMLPGETMESALRRMETERKFT